VTSALVVSPCIIGSRVSLQPLKPLTRAGAEAKQAIKNVTFPRSQFGVLTSTISSPAQHSSAASAPPPPPSSVNTCASPHPSTNRRTATERRGNQPGPTASAALSLWLPRRRHRAPANASERQRTPASPGERQRTPASSGERQRAPDGSQTGRRVGREKARICFCGGRLQGGGGAAGVRYVWRGGGKGQQGIRRRGRGARRRARALKWALFRWRRGSRVGFPGGLEGRCCRGACEGLAPRLTAPARNFERASRRAVKAWRKCEGVLTARRGKLAKVRGRPHGAP